ncbi:MAG: 16S rRNA (guanine(966)-N(2))-methyltransferase RsmD [Candidatus Hydrogenedentes bacterium]|nr:16S rRNA (guanine(966)-N(2))-methyltransferase RsmD [Candidatus Hydrogenedentota bacterium]
MRVIAGTARGVRLFAPRGYDVRPTLDRVRESLFNILSPRMEGSRFLDLYAGTGANGIEALSRGADFATFVDNDPRSLAAIERNLAAAKLRQLADVRRLPLPEGLRTLWADGKAYDIIFADPPFAGVEYDRLLSAICSARVLGEGSLIVVEHSSRVVLPDELGSLSRDRVSKYGEISLSFFS